jgi:hypothetical protein
LTLASLAILLVALILRSNAAADLVPGARWAEGGEQYIKQYWRDHYPTRVILALLGVGAAAGVAGVVYRRGLRMWAVMAAVVHLLWFGMVLWWWRTP